VETVIFIFFFHFSRNSSKFFVSTFVLFLAIYMSTPVLTRKTLDLKSVDIHELLKLWDIVKRSKTVEVRLDENTDSDLPNSITSLPESHSESSESEDADNTAQK